MNKFDELLEAQDNPELKDFINTLLLTFNLACMAASFPNPLTGEQAVAIAKRTAQKVAEGDRETEESLLNILMAYLRSQG